MRFSDILPSTLLSSLLLLGLVVDGNTSAAPPNKFPTVEMLPLRTQGRWVVDQQGNRLKLTCVNWHGAHMESFVSSGLDVQTPDAIASRLRRMGFNCVRLNWSVEMVLTNPVVNDDAIRAMLDAGVVKAGVHALDIYDKVVEALSKCGVMTILDNHISQAGWCCDVRDGNGLWFNEEYPTASWEQAWTLMAGRYRDNLHVIGADIRNELRPDLRIEGGLIKKLSVRLPQWGGGDKVLSLRDYAPDLLNFHHPALNSTKHRAMLFIIEKLLSGTEVKLFDWHSAATECGNKIIGANPNLLIFLQGMFDLYSFTPNIIQMILYYLKADQTLYNSIGKYLDIPDEATRVYQLQNLTGFGDLPLTLNEPNHVVYVAHIYPFFYTSAAYDWSATSPGYEKFSADIEKFWGYLFLKNIAPVWVGETGTDANQDGLTSKWTDYHVRYLYEHDLDFAYWPLGDARPQVDKGGVFHHGEDSYALLNKNHDDFKYRPAYDSMLSILDGRLGPSGRNVTENPPPLIMQL